MSDRHFRQESSERSSKNSRRRNWIYQQLLVATYCSWCESRQKSTLHFEGSLHCQAVRWRSFRSVRWLLITQCLYCQVIKNRILLFLEWIKPRLFHQTRNHPRTSELEWFAQPIRSPSWSNYPRFFRTVMIHEQWIHGPWLIVTQFKSPTPLGSVFKWTLAFDYSYYKG